MQSLKSPYILYNQQSVGSTLHNNLLFITNTAFLIHDCYCLHFSTTCYLLLYIAVNLRLKKSSFDFFLFLFPIKRRACHTSLTFNNRLVVKLCAETFASSVIFHFRYPIFLNQVSLRISKPKPFRAASMRRWCA